MIFLLIASCTTQKHPETTTAQTTEHKEEITNDEQTPLIIETTFFCNEKPSLQKKEYCEKPVIDTLETPFYAAVVVNNAGCENKETKGTCTAMLTDEEGNIIYDTEKDIGGSADCSKQTKLLCPFEFEPDILEAGTYYISFIIEDTINDKAISEELEFNVS